MNKTQFFLVAALVVAAGAAGSYWLHYGSTEQEMRRACSRVLAERLKSPSTLKVVRWYPMRTKAATKDDAVGPQPTREEYGDRYDKALELYQLNERIFDEHPGGTLQILFEYDAANSFGAVLRRQSICSYYTYRPDKRQSISPLTLKVDGETSLGWSMKQLERYW